MLEAKATRDSQTAQTLPTGDIQGNISRQHAYNIGPKSNDLFPIGGVTDTKSANFDVSWELDLFGRLREARRVANATQAEARFDIEGARASLAASVADNYFQAKGYAIQLSDALETVRIDQSLFNVAQRKSDLGLGARSDADQLGRRAGAGALPGRGPAGAAAHRPAPAADPGGPRHRRHRQRADGRGGPRRAQAAGRHPRRPADPPPRHPRSRRRICAPRRGPENCATWRYSRPSPCCRGWGLRASHRPASPSFRPSTLLPAQQTTDLGFWQLGAGVSVPVLDIPRLLYDAKAEDARTEQAVIAYEKTVQTAYGEAENALVNLGAGERAVGVLVDGEARARRAFADSQTRYKMGLDDLTAMLSAEQTWRTTRSALTSERVQALRRAVQTYKALGGGWAFAAASTPANRASNKSARTQ